MNRSMAGQFAGAMLMRGTTKRTRQQIQDEIDRLKARVNVFGGTDQRRRSGRNHAREPAGRAPPGGRNSAGAGVSRRRVRAAQAAAAGRPRAGQERAAGDRSARAAAAPATLSRRATSATSRRSRNRSPTSRRSRSTTPRSSTPTSTAPRTASWRSSATSTRAEISKLATELFGVVEISTSVRAGRRQLPGRPGDQPVVRDAGQGQRLLHGRHQPERAGHRSGLRGARARATTCWAADS